MNVQAQEITWFSTEQVELIITAFQSHHAILVTGLQGIGKSHLVSRVCHQLLTKRVTHNAETLCWAGTHPDLHVLTSAFAYHLLEPQLQKFSLRYLDAEMLEKKRLSRQIGVNRIRKLVESMSEASATGGYKLAVIYPAEHLNINSANALLKFLEEPTGNTLFMLVTHDISMLPATIRSRCMHINIPPPHRQTSLDWLALNHPDKTPQANNHALKLAAGRPLLANHFIRANQQLLVDELIDDVSQIVFNKQTNIMSLSKKWLKHKQTDFILNWLGWFFTDLIKIKLSGNAASANTKSSLESLAEKLTTDKLFQAYDYFITLNHGYDGVVDETLLIEDALLTINKTANH